MYLPSGTKLQLLGYSDFKCDGEQINLESESSLFTIQEKGIVVDVESREMERKMKGFLIKVIFYLRKKYAQILLKSQYFVELSLLKIIEEHCYND